MNKFIYRGNLHATEHWEYCERYKYPYIEVYRLNTTISNLFYDITFMKNIDIAEVSATITILTKYYYKFFNVNFSETNTDYSTKYLFDFSVLNSHAVFVAESLFDFLVNQIMT